jgi:two-component system sensor histidine kinase YesM
MKSRLRLKLSKPRYVSLFTKSVVAFLLIGIIPLFIVGLAVSNAYANNLQNTLLTNLSQMTLSVGNNIASIFDEMDQDTKYLYNYRIALDYDYFYQILQDRNITETRRNFYVTNVLRNIIYRNQYIDHIVFFSKDGKVYSSVRPPENTLNVNAFQEWHRKEYRPGCKATILIPTHLSDYYYYSKTFNFSFSRNIMDTQSIQTATHTVLGTIYIDINIKYLTDIIQKADFGEGHEVNVIDREQKTYVYSQYDYNIGKEAGDFYALIPKMTENHGYLKTSNYYFLYSSIPNCNWIVVDRVPVSKIENSYKNVRDYTAILLCVGSILLSAVYLYYSKKTNRPIQMLKEAMGRIQHGDLDINLNLSSCDEIGLVANGLNQMAANLKSYINRVYLAEIQQKNAELEMLKTRIQPHYLYNTLDVIRMMAITNDDQVTAKMLNSLSAQLKYLIGPSNDMVTLDSEIDNIVHYFELIRIRFDDRFSLEIHVPDDLLRVRVPRLILQPIVENAVDHGLRPKRGNGLIALYAKRNDQSELQITVLDNGVGMSERNLKELQDFMNSQDSGYRRGAIWKDIGLKNVNERIHLIYGKNNGLEISSVEGMGTIVNIHFPLDLKGKADV